MKGKCQPIYNCVLKTQLLIDNVINEENAVIHLSLVSMLTVDLHYCTDKGCLEKSGNSFNFEAYLKFYHRHIIDIPRINFGCNDEIELNSSKGEESVEKI